MDSLKEAIEITINRHNPHIDPSLSLWRWEIPTYLFLGGLTAGILLLSGILYLLKKEEEFPFATRIAPIFAPPILALGMLFLFLDLEHKLYVWRLYLTFEWSSPMSWGSWALILIFPSSILFGIMQLDLDMRTKFSQLLVNAKYANKQFVYLDSILQKLYSFLDAKKIYIPILAYTNIVMGAFIGIYTGILLSSFISRPFWNTPILGILFLTSGISAASAFMMLGTKKIEEEHTMAKLDILFLILELFLLAQIFIGYFTSSAYHNQAGRMIFGGNYTGVFWMLVVLQGVCFPLFMEIMELKHVFKFKYLTPISVLVGGFLLRIMFVYLGQMSKVELSL
ncbi:MAG: polysulfide reductase NrfD [Leptospiraceae bacterium]|nr:polysulfide reductase NrfD [Leptospiraceae bacterium]